MVKLAKGDYEEPVRKKGDVRAWLADGGRLTFRLNSFGKGSLNGTCQTFGSAKFNLDSFSFLEFNIYDEDLIRLRSDEGGGW